MGEELVRSPLVEAVCEFRFEVVDLPTNDQLARFFDRLVDDFSERSTVDDEQLQVLMEAGVPRARFTTNRRFQFQRPDGSALLQIGAGVLVVNYLPRYQGWDSYRPTILRVVQAHVEAMGPSTITLTKLRYINRLEAPADKRPAVIDDIIAVRPTLPGPLKLQIHDFYQRFELQSEVGLMVHQTGSLRGEAVLMLDLDVTSGERRRSDEAEALSAWLEKAHKFIGDAFVASLNPGYYLSLKEGRS